MSDGAGGAPGRRREERVGERGRSKKALRIGLLTSGAILSRCSITGCVLTWPRKRSVCRKRACGASRRRIVVGRRPTC